MIDQLQGDTDFSTGELVAVLQSANPGSDGRFVKEALRKARHAEHDLQAAQEVQSWLFPQHCPIIPGLAYAGACRQAHQLGGDFYDFIGLGAGQLGIVVGDVAGKGVAAALSMATLRTLLRSQFSEKSGHLTRALATVNRLFYESTPAASYATLFLAHYDDATRRLRYVNCGHPAPLVCQADGRISRLNPTATAVGLFHDWHASESEVELSPGNMLAIYTDGVTEAINDSGEEFGVDQLVERLTACKHLQVSEVARNVVAEVLEFSGEQQDDLTLVGIRAL